MSYAIVRATFTALLLLTTAEWSAASKGSGSRPTPTPPPPQTGPAAPALVAPANGASVVQPITLDWNATSASGGPIGSYTWQVATSSAFTSIVASGFTNIDNLPSVPTATDAQLSGLANGTYFWRVKATQMVGGATGS